MRPKLTIGVTALNAIDSPGPGVPVIRALKEAASFDVRIIGLAYETLEPGIYMHELVDKTYTIPYPSVGMDILMDRLSYIHEQEKLDVIIPNFDAELFAFMKLEGRLRKMGIHTFLPSLEQFEERQKYNLSDFGKKYHFHVPESVAINSPAEIHKAGSEFGYPMVVKGKFYDAMIAYDEEQAKMYFHKIAAKWGMPIIVQKHVQGAEFNAIGLGDGKGNTIAAVAMRKQYITDKGKAWGGITVDDKKMLDLAHKFISATKWRGAFELELIKAQDNEYYILEINPRIPAWVYLAVGVGQNIPEALVKLAMGEEVKAYQEYEVGKMFVRYSYDMIVDRSDFEKISMLGEL